jgi:hypothetical protein
VTSLIGVAERSRPPLAASATLTVAIGWHLCTVATGVTDTHFIPAIDWAALAAAEMALLIVVLSRPAMFRVRRFRLPGIAIAAMGTIILVPLPGIVRLYRDQVPASTVLSIAGGIAAFAVVFGLAPTPSKSVVRPSKPAFDRSLALVIVAFALVLFPIWLRSLQTVPILDLLRGTSTGIDIALARDAAFMGLTALPLRIAIAAVRNVYLMFAAAWLVSDWIVTPRAEWRTRSVRRLCATAAVALAALYALVTTERAVLGQVVVVVVVTAFVASRRSLSLKAMLVAGPAALAFPVVFGLLNSGGGGFARVSAAFESVRRRIFYVPGDVMIHYFTAFPEKQGFLRGRAVPKVPRLFGVETFDLSQFVYVTYYQVDARLVGNANGSFLGVGWANFGPAGVVIWCAIAAAILVALEHVLAGLPRRTSAALRAVAVVQTVFLTSVDVFRSIAGFAPGYIDLVIAALVFSWLFRRRRVTATTHRHRVSHRPVPAAGA